MTSVDALEFGPCHERAALTMYGGVPIRVLAKEDLLTNKRAAGRTQGLLDVENLEKS